MKFLKYIIPCLLGVALVVSSSCRKMLIQPDDSFITADSVFNNPDNAMQALFNVYATCVVNGFPTGDGGSGTNDSGTRNGMLLAAADEGDQVGTGSTANLFNSGTWGPGNQGEFDINRVTLGMRNASLFIENAEKVPFKNTTLYDWNERLRDQTVAEAKFLRALMHYEMMIRFGGIPLMYSVPKVVITRVDGLNKAEVVPTGRRQSVKSTIDFIVKSCDEAVPALPNDYPEADKGRVTKGAALALKAVTLLHAASPLFNSATPYLSLGGADSLLCLGNYDVNRWKQAADASKAVIDWAAANDYSLLDDPALGKMESYNIATGLALDPRNREVLFADRSHGRQNGGSNVNRYFNPHWFTWGGTALGIPINFVTKSYRNSAGQDIVIPTTGSYSQLKNIYRSIEPRFHSTAWWPGSRYTNTGTYTAPSISGAQDTAVFVYKQTNATGTFVVAGSGGTSLIGHGIPNGISMKKFLNLTNAAANIVELFWPIFRLSEFYLNHAEALNEVNPSDPQILTSLNVVRRRGGLPDLAPGNPIYNANFGDKDKMRRVIQRERAVELYGEEHRFFDVRRWKIAAEDGVMKGDFYRIFLHQNGPTAYVTPTPSMTPAQRLANDNRLAYQIEKFETRSWEDKMYLYPFPQDEINKGFLVQNPGW